MSGGEMLELGDGVRLGASEGGLISSRLGDQRVNWIRGRME